MAGKKEEEQFKSVEEEISATLIELVLSDKTQDETRIKVINKLLEGKQAQDFFDTMIEEELSYGECPHCKHENHWAVPEEELNKRGIVTHQIDARVPRNTNSQSCAEYEQACAKKKLSA